MHDDAPFLAAIAAKPEDDGPRLVYADWLDEKGDTARAEFIRLQCALEHVEALVADDFGKLCQRERLLLEENWRTWIRPVCNVLGEPSPANPRRFQELRDRFMRARNKEIPRPTYHLSFDTPESDRFHAIVRQQGIGTEEPYFQSARFQRGFVNAVSLRAKSYRTQLHLGRLFDATPLTDLSLDHFDPASIHYLANNDRLARLRSLTLQIGDLRVLTAIANSKDSSALQNLALWVDDPDREPAGIVAKSLYLRNLTILILWSVGVQNEGVVSLANSPVLETVRYLTVSGLGDGAAFALAASTYVSQLEMLVIPSNGLSPAAAATLRERFGDVLMY